MKYATDAIDRFCEPARDEAVRLAAETITTSWPKFWDNHKRKLENHLMNPEAELSAYKHGITLNIVLGVEGMGLVIHPEISFGFKEKYVGEEVEVNGQQKLPFDGMDVELSASGEGPVVDAVLAAAKKAGVKVTKVKRESKFK